MELNFEYFQKVADGTLPFVMHFPNQMVRVFYLDSSNGRIMQAEAETELGLWNNREISPPWHAYTTKEFKDIKSFNIPTDVYFAYPSDSFTVKFLYYDTVDKIFKPIIPTTYSIIKFDSGDEVVQWEAETDRFTEMYLGEKATSKIKLEVELEEGSLIDVYLKLDDEDYVKIDTYEGTGYTYFKTYQIPQQCFYSQIKLIGTGKAIIYSLTRDIIIMDD